MELPDIQNLLASWWFEYDQGNFEVWPAFFTSDAHFSCRSDSGRTDFEQFIRADLSGRDEVLSWQIEHRRNSPYPLRHHATDVHVSAFREGEADFRCYLFVTQIVDGAVSNLSTGICLGTARTDVGAVRMADLRVILDFTNSEIFSAEARRQPA